MEKAEIIKAYTCKDCSFPVIMCYATPLQMMFAEAANSIVWLYCANKTCKNHDGNGLPTGENPVHPEWIDRKPNRNKDRTQLVKDNWEIMEKISTGKLTTKSIEVKKFVQRLRDTGEYAQGTVVVDVIRHLKKVYQVLKLKETVKQ